MAENKEYMIHQEDDGSILTCAIIILSDFVPYL